SGALPGLEPGPVCTGIGVEPRSARGGGGGGGPIGIGHSVSSPRTVVGRPLRPNAPGRGYLHVTDEPSGSNRGAQRPISPHAFALAPPRRPAPKAVDRQRECR